MPISATFISISGRHSAPIIWYISMNLDVMTVLASRKTGWSPLGITPVPVTRFHRNRRYQILPAYSQDGIELVRIYPGSTDSEVFEDFIEQLLQHCGRWPEPKSVLIMDNASFHRTDGSSSCVRKPG